jgi:hypothetical protein
MQGKPKDIIFIIKQRESVCHSQWRLPGERVCGSKLQLGEIQETPKNVSSLHNNE